MSEIIIIGAGASGLMAAIAAGQLLADAPKPVSKADGPRVLVLERMDRPGKKLLATGNGRCNFSNMHISGECYHSDTPALIPRVFESFSPKQTRDFFQELGIVIKNKNGYLYPRSAQAASVLEVLLARLSSLPVEIKTGCPVRRIRPEAHGYAVEDGEGHVWHGRKVIVACGGCAYRKLGSDGSGYDLARSAGLKVIQPLPALTGLHTRQHFFKKVSGVRTDGQITLYRTEGDTLKMLAKDTGELQLTDYGVSGIPAFQVSRWASKALAQKQRVVLTLDFMPELSLGELFAFLTKRRSLQLDLPVGNFFTGMFPKKLGALFLELSGIRDVVPVRELNKKALGALCQCIKSLAADVTATGGFDSAQVCAGGVDGHELTAHMESKKKPGLYFTGELVDVDGICGGYNLQWAWSSGYTAGSHSAGQVLKERTTI